MMKNIFNSLKLLVFVLLVTSCSDDNNTKVPVVDLKQITLNLQTHDAYIDLGASSAYELLSELPDWLEVELVSRDKLYHLRFFAQENAKQRRSTEVEIGRPSGNIKIQITQSPIQQKGLFILSEAGWESSSSDLAYYDELEDKLYPRYFSEKNGRTLGDVGNDLAIYGSKMYVVVSGSNVQAKNSFIEVVDPKTGKSLKQIPFIVDKTSDTYDLPRRFIFDGGKGYITGFSGIVARLDTVSLELDAFAKLGEGASHSEGITKYKDRLYICNSGYGKGNTLSVVDIKAFKEIKQIEVAQNPVNITTGNNGKVYFQTATIFDKNIPSNLYELDPESDLVSHTFNVAASKLAILDDVLYTGDFGWLTMEDEASKIDLKTKSVTPLKFDSDQFLMVYSFDVNPISKLIYIGTQGDDAVTVDTDGNFISKVNVEVPYVNKILSILR